MKKMHHESRDNSMASRSVLHVAMSVESAVTAALLSVQLSVALPSASNHSQLSSVVAFGSASTGSACVICPGSVSGGEVMTEVSVLMLA